MEHVEVKTLQLDFQKFQATWYLTCAFIYIKKTSTRLFKRATITAIFFN